MGKRALKKYVSDLPKEALEEQLLDLYDRFPAVKEYYNFIFEPKEEALIHQAKVKISNEYFPLKRKRAKARRSVAQNFIKKYGLLGMDSNYLADLMLYNLETAQLFSQDHKVNLSFYNSMEKSFKQAVTHVVYNGLLPDYEVRIRRILQDADSQNWPVVDTMEDTLEELL